jgi:hypothetical protein
MAKKIGDAIAIQLAKFQKGSYSQTKTAELAKSINSYRTALIHFPTRFSEDSDAKSPDKSSKYKDCKYPRLVIKVAWSQEQKDLPKLAERYFQASEGGIHTVVGINLEYNRKIGSPGSKAKPATFSV